MVKKEQLDAKTAELCSLLKTTPDVTKYSLELQLWWRDHQRADKDRLAKERRERSLAKAKQSALSKLSPTEKKALGI